MKVAYYRGEELRPGMMIRSVRGKDYIFLGLNRRHAWVRVRDPEGIRSENCFVFAYSVFPKLEVRDE